MNGSSLFGRLIVGFLADRYMGYFNSVIALSFISGVFGLAWIGSKDSASLIVWACLYGFSSGAIISVFTPATARVCPDPKSYMGIWLGMSCAVISFPLLASAPIAGKLLDETNDYLSIHLFVAISLLASSAVFVAARFSFNRTALVY